MYDKIPKINPATVKDGRIVAAHVYPVWTPGEAGLHNAFLDLKNYPERTPLGGYYNESDPDVQDVHIKWALEHGINCFIFCSADARIVLRLSFRSSLSATAPS